MGGKNEALKCGPTNRSEGGQKNNDSLSNRGISPPLDSSTSLFGREKFPFSGEGGRMGGDSNAPKERIQKMISMGGKVGPN